MYDGVTMFFFLSLSPSLFLFSKKDSPWDDGMFRDPRGCSIHYRVLSRDSPALGDRSYIISLSRRSVTSRKDEISFHETSERNTRRLSLRGDTLPHFPSYIHRVVSLYSELDEMYRCELVIFRSSFAIFTKIHKTEQLNILSILRVSFLLLFLSLVFISLFSYTLL